MTAKAFSASDLVGMIGNSECRPTVFLETSSFDCSNKTSYLFTDFDRTLTFKPGDDIGDFFSCIEQLRRRGFWLAGYFTYEFGYFLDPALRNLKKGARFPLAWLGVCRRPRMIDHAFYRPRCNDSVRAVYSVKNMRPSLDYREYRRQIEKIKLYLAQGLTYQVNHTFRIRFDFAGDPVGFYLDLRRAQPTAYSAFIRTENSCLLSFSPELFFRLKNNRIVVRPMKGTMPLGLDSSRDRENIRQLQTSPKTRAENIMIVDLLRNDLGRIASGVRVTHLFNVERYRTLYQLTSVIEADLKKGIGAFEIFQALFPSGSVTGAPKIKTMQLIHSLEKESRGIYTGSIGYIHGNEFCFNVAIRTLELKNGKAVMGVGGGIVADSRARDEFREAGLKYEFVRRRFTDFVLIESMLWESGKGYFLPDLHLGRMKTSAAYFCIPFPERLIRKKLASLVGCLSGPRFKVRLTLGLEGEVAVEYGPLDLPETPVRIGLSSRRTDPGNAYLYHKTSRRNLYDIQLRQAQQKGMFEIIFLNRRGELTEGSFTNIFLCRNGSLYTPVLSCGLLPGVLREHLLKSGRAQEEVLYPQDLRQADKVYVGNSVRGLLEARPCF